MLLPVSMSVSYHFKKGFRKRLNRLEQATGSCNQLHSQRDPVRAQEAGEGTSNDLAADQDQKTFTFYFMWHKANAML